MAKPANPTCLDCRFLVFEPGETGYYPGEGRCPSVGCQKQVWRLEFEDGQEEFVRCLRTAVECELFEPQGA